MPRRGDVINGKYHSLLVKQRISSQRNQTFSRPRIGAADQRTCSTELMTSPMNRREQNGEPKRNKDVGQPLRIPSSFCWLAHQRPSRYLLLTRWPHVDGPAFRQSGHRWNAGSSTFSLIHPLLRAEKTQRVCQSMIAGLLVTLEIRTGFARGARCRVFCRTKYGCVQRAYICSLLSGPGAPQKMQRIAERCLGRIVLPTRVIIVDLHS